MELIDRRATIEKFCSDYCGCTPEECDLTYEKDGTEECEEIRRLKEMPSIDAVEVVRCKDCEFYTADDRWCRRLGLVGAFDQNDYCSRGERRDDEAD